MTNEEKFAAQSAIQAGRPTPFEGRWRFCQFPIDRWFQGQSRGPRTHYHCCWRSYFVGGIGDANDPWTQETESPMRRSRRTQALKRTADAFSTVGGIVISIAAP